MKWAYVFLACSALILLIGLTASGFGLTSHINIIRLASKVQSAGSEQALDVASNLRGSEDVDSSASSASVATDLQSHHMSLSGKPTETEEEHSASQANSPGLTVGVERVYQGAALAGVCLILLLPIIVRGRCDKFQFGVTLVAYLSSSILLSLLNKALVVISNAPYGLLIFQFLFADAAILACFGCNTLFEAPPRDLWRWGLLVFPFTGMLVSSLLALQSGTVTLLVVVRGIVPLLALVVERLLRLHQASEVTWEGVASLALILIGVVLFVATGVHVNIIGLGWCIVNVFCTLGSRVMERALLVDDSMNLSFAAMNLLNNILAVFPSFILWLFSKESNPVQVLYAIDGNPLDNFIALVTERWFDVTLLLLSGVLGITVGWYGIAVQAEVTATTMAVVQAISRVVTVVLAACFLHETVTLVMWAGFLLTLMGGSWYKLRGERKLT